MGSAAGDLGRAIGDGIAGLVGHAIGVLGAAFDGVVGSLRSVLPGPALPIAIVVVLLGLGWLLLKR